METLLNIVVSNAASALVLALIVAGVERFLLHRPALVHGFWLLVLIRLLMPPVWTPEITLIASAVIPESALESQATGTLTLPVPASALASTAILLDAEITEGPRILLIVLCLAMSGALALYAGVAIWRLRLVCGRADPVEPVLAARWNALAVQLGILQPPPLCSVSERTSPMLVSIFGWSRVLLPSALWQQLSEHERDTLLLHELAHWKRRDHWVRHIELIALTAFWWHPAAWWASWRLRQAEERACDALVADTLPNHRRAYADGLIETMRYLASGRSATCALASGIRVANDLKGRIEMILDGYRPATLPKLAQLAVGAALVAALTLTPVFTASTASADTASVNETVSVNKTVSVNEPILVNPTILLNQSVLLNQDFSGTEINLHVDNVELIDSLRHLADVSGLNVVVEPDVDVSAKVTVHLDSAPWDQALVRLLEVKNLTYTLEGNVLWIHRYSPRLAETRLYAGQPIDLHVQQADLRQVPTELGSYAELELVLDEGVWGTVDLALTEVPWDQALDIVLRVNNLDMSVENGVLRVMEGC